ncbi:MAG: hypothetical protein ACXVDD_06295 [Polyangia bacterium]
MRLAALSACVLAAASSVARAASAPSFALVYQAPEGAGCPSDEAVRSAVAGELGYDPWDPVDDGGSPRIVVGIHAVRDGVRGRVEMRATDGKRLGARELEAPSCAELTRALELAIAVAIDPLRAGPRPAPPSDATPRPPVIVPPPPPLRLAAPPPRHRLVDELRLRVAFGVQGTVAAAPGPTFGFMGRVGFALRRWSLAIELRGDLPGSADVDGGRVSASTMAAFLVPCLFHRIVAFCAIGGAGGQEVAGSGFLASRSSWVPYGALGARIELELPVSSVLAVLIHVDVMAPLTRAELYVGTERPQRVYRSAAISNSFGLALSTR